MGLITETETYGLNRMTKKAIIDSCKKNKLYITPHLNDVLYLHFQGYQKIEDLDEYTGLKCLWLESNAITEISGLDNQKLLKCLFLHNNLIAKIENLEGCKELDTLNLSHNQVMHVGNCGSDILPVLNTLNLANNYLRTAESIEILRTCNHLSVLDLSNNRIDDILVVKIFADMLELKVLVLTGNPVINEIPSYRKTLIVECKKLTYLDTRPVFPRDRACAEAWKRGGFQEERRENIRWNKEERREMLRSVNATLRMRNRGGGEPSVQLIPTDSSDDDEYYSREMRPKKQCEDVSSTEQWNILDEMMRNPEAVDNYQSCKVCGSAYCKYQHIENGEIIKDMEISTEEIIESSNFSILWGDDDLGVKEEISDEKLADASCSYITDPSEQDNESEIVEEINSTTENITKISADCFIKSTTIAISGNANPEMLNKIGNLMKVTICPEDCDSDDDENDFIETADVVNNVVDNYTTIDIPENREIAEKLPEHDNIHDMCELVHDFKFDSSSDSVESNLDTSLDCCINMEDAICSFRAKSIKEVENDFIQCNINHATEESFIPTDLSTLWEENSLAELDATDSIDSHENEETVVIGKSIVESENVEEYCLNASIALSSINIEAATYANTASFVTPRIEKNQEGVSLEVVSTNYSRNEDDTNACNINIEADPSLSLVSTNVVKNVDDSNNNDVNVSMTSCHINTEIIISSNIAESDDSRNEHDSKESSSIEEAPIAMCNLNTKEATSSNSAKSHDPEHDDDSNKTYIDASIVNKIYLKGTMLEASTVINNTNAELATYPNENDSNIVQYIDFIREIDPTVDDMNITHAVLGTPRIEKNEEDVSLGVVSTNDPGNEDDTNASLYVSIAPNNIKIEEDSSLAMAKINDPRIKDDSNETHVDVSMASCNINTEADSSLALVSTNVVNNLDDSNNNDVDVSMTPCHINTEIIISSNKAESDDSRNEQDSKESLRIEEAPIAMCNLNTEEATYREIDPTIDDMNITHAVIETIETENSEILLNFACTIPNIESADQYTEGDLEVPVECNVNTCVFENYKTKAARTTSQGNEFLISRIKKNCFDLNEMMKSKIERNQTTNIITMSDDEDEPEEYEDVDNTSKIEVLGYSSFVASYEQFFNENEPKSAQFIKTENFSSLYTEENDNSIDNVQVEEKFDCDVPNVDDIPAMKNFRVYRAHLKSLLHRDSELQISCNELLNQITEKLEAIERIDKPLTEDDVSIMELPINSKNSLLTPSNSFYKICYDDPNSSLEYVSIANDIEENQSPDVNLDTIQETEDDESKDVN